LGHDFSEDSLVEQPAMALFSHLNWMTACGLDDLGNSLDRETKAEVIIRARLKSALRILNPSLHEGAITSACDQLARDRSAMGHEAANRDVYGLLKNGVLISVRDPKGGQKQERVRVIDWENPENNDFLVVNQLKITGPMYSCIPDVIGFVNGLPLVVLELKQPGVPAKQAFEDNITSYKHALNGVPQLFWYNALLIASNGSDSRVGSLTADWERFFEWKRIEREAETKTVSLETMIRGTCEPHRLLDLIENFTLFSRQDARLIKIIGQNHQFLGVNNAIAKAMEGRAQGHGQGGVFWQTQGSGKSFSMVFFAQKILRKVPGNWTFVIVTDRQELDMQIARTFKAVDAVTDAEGDECHASNGVHLRELLRGNHRYVFTLIHKFQSDEMLSDRNDVIVLVDEAHRSQYDTLAINMRSALPNALFVAFTGTPLIAGEERTREIFGDYVSIYDFQQSVEDGATVPLFYENRTPELKLENPDLNDQIYDLIERADLDTEQQEKLDRELGRQYHLITRDDRLETVAKDIVRHFLGRGLLGDGKPGKAMVVSIDKATAIRMYDKVNVIWSERMRWVNGEIARREPTGADVTDLKAELKVLESTDMAVVVSPGQNEIEQMKALGIDIIRHRERMNKERLDEKFKDTKDPLRLVFVCAMWLTGFDAPSCSTVYLDKPMRNHTLMQTIARANRVYPGKHSGVIVDYANVFLSLEKALAIYGTGQGGQMPVRDKQRLVEDLRFTLEEANAFCQTYSVNLNGIASLPATGFARLGAIGDAVDALIAPESLRKDYFALERLVSALYNAIKPNPAVSEFSGRVACLSAIAGAIRAKLHPEPIDISDVMSGINRLLDESITGVSIKVKETTKVDLSKIDFVALSKKFKNSKHKNTEIEMLKAAIRARLDGLIQLNKTRTDFLEKFEALIDAYNSGAANIEDLFKQLVEFTSTLSEEEHRHVRENLTEEELVIFDILTRPAPKLSTEERSEVKKVARLLLDRLKDLLIIDWRTGQGSRSRVQLAIEDTLDDGLPRAFTPDLYKSKCAAVFDHFFEKYPDKSTSVYEQPK
jgi:type I restriction enzyme, R subunit